MWLVSWQRSTPRIVASVKSRVTLPLPVALGERVGVCEAAIKEMRPTFEKTKDAWLKAGGALLLIVTVAGIVGTAAAFLRDIVTVKVGLR